MNEVHYEHFSPKAPRSGYSSNQLNFHTFSQNAQQPATFSNEANHTSRITEEAISLRIRQPVFESAERKMAGKPHMRGVKEVPLLEFNNNSGSEQESVNEFKRIETLSSLDNSRGNSKQKSARGD